MAPGPAEPMTLCSVGPVSVPLFLPSYPSQGPVTPYLGPSPFNTRPSPPHPPPGSLRAEG